MVAQRTLTPYVRVRILLPLPRKSTESIALSVLFSCFMLILASKSSGTLSCVPVIPLNLPQLWFSLHRAKALSVNTSIDHCEPVEYFYARSSFSKYPCIRAALSSFMRSETWPYTSNVNAAVAWPRFSCTVFTSSPFCNERTAKV